MAQERAFLATCALVFMASAAGTIYFCRSMSGGMAMPGGWTMSMAWMRMPGQSWLGAAAGFIVMWEVMMLAMMLPSLVPTLWRYHRSVRESNRDHGRWLTAFAGAAYFFVWAVFGATVYILGRTLTAAEMRWFPLARYVPVATGAALLLAGVFQLTAWKARRLNRCRDAAVCNVSASSNVSTAWRRGQGWGVDCGLCCCGFMAILLVAGVMNLATMAVLAVAITVERLVPRPELAARLAGVVMITLGSLLLVRVGHR